MTYLSEIFDIFLSKISDYAFLKISEDEIERELLKYFKTAKSKFYKCKSDLTLSEFEVEAEDGELKTILVFQEELHPFEIEVIVSLMLVEYLKPLILSSETLKQSLSDKDFKIYSQANHIRELGLLYRSFKKEAGKMITEYSYIGMTDNDKK